MQAHANHDGERVIALDSIMEEIRRAKVALSGGAPDAVVLLGLPSIRSYPLRAEELDEIVLDVVNETVAKLRETITSAGLEPRQLERVYLMGGSSGLRSVSSRVASGLQLAKPPLLIGDPKLGIALGAARWMAGKHGVRPAAPPVARTPYRSVTALHRVDTLAARMNLAFAWKSPTATMVVGNRHLIARDETTAHPGTAAYVLKAKEGWVAQGRRVVRERACDVLGSKGIELIVTRSKDSPDSDAEARRYLVVGQRAYWLTADVRNAALLDGFSRIPSRREPSKYFETAFAYHDASAGIEERLDVQVTGTPGLTFFILVKPSRPTPRWISGSRGGCRTSRAGEGSVSPLTASS
jgi:hypothetical protein